MKRILSEDQRTPTIRAVGIYNCSRVPRVFTRGWIEQLRTRRRRSLRIPMLLSSGSSLNFEPKKAPISSAYETDQFQKPKYSIVNQIYLSID